MIQSFLRFGIVTVVFVAATNVALADELLSQQAFAAMKRAVEFYSRHVAAHGGYVYRYSHDLAKREGEGKTGPDTVWVQPPGTHRSEPLISMPTHARTKRICWRPPAFLTPFPFHLFLSECRQPRRSARALSWSQ